MPAVPIMGHSRRSPEPGPGSLCVQSPLDPLATLSTLPVTSKGRYLLLCVQGLSSGPERVCASDPQCRSMNTPAYLHRVLFIQSLPLRWAVFPSDESSPHTMSPDSSPFSWDDAPGFHCGYRLTSPPLWAASLPHNHALTLSWHSLPCPNKSWT